MSSIVLSSAVRQNLLALQQTAAELATTQNDLSTGKKVNSALDNPTNYFTASGLDNRASDISNLLDGISNGVQVLQAANTGLTSLQSLVSQAKSIANQALQTSIGYSTKASITTSIGATATATNLFGTVDTAGTVTGSVILNQAATPVAVTGATKLSGASPSDSLPAAAIADGSTLTVNGQQITFHTGTGTNTESANGATIYTGNASSTVQTVLDSINAIAGAGTASLSAGAIVLSSGTSSAGITFGGTGSLLSSLGLGTVTSTGLGTSVTALNAAPTTIVGTTASTLNNLVLTIPATSSTATATSLTFGSGAGQISTLTGLNTALAANNLAATLDSNGNLQITTTNDAASSSIGTITAKIGGTAVTSGAFYQPTYIASPVADTASQNTRSNLVSQYNAILTQINNTATDASYNGVNLLNGDQLELTFDETGKSKLNITGVQDSAAGLGLSTLQSNAFVDNNATNTVLNNLNNVSTTLRSQASAFGSNLSVVQTRQDFNTNLINVLQTGSANLTQADINEEAANSQALSTRQSLSISALSLANQAQQSVLQLLR